MSKQNRRSFITNTAIAAAGVAGLPLLQKGAKKMVIHHVFFWLKNKSSKQDLAKLVTGLQTLKKIKTVQRIHIGLPAATEDRTVVDSSYSASELLFFNDLAGQKAYQDDPIHLKFIADCSSLWEKVVVYDSVDV
ncbi:MAG: Dabb family protein [Chitinophagaceae bacterium]